MYRTKYAIVATLGVALLLNVGCGKRRPDTAAVSGRVTYQGKPVVEGRIMFLPAAGRPATGTINPDGTYRLTCFDAGDGAMLGSHRVTIEARRITVPNAPKSFADEGKGGALGPPQVEWLVPEKYAGPDTSTLTAEVKAGENVIDFNLP